MSTYKRLRPSQISLDPENPRLPDGTSTDAEAIARLLDEGAGALQKLARDIVEQGSLNPSEPPIVMRDGKKFIALEGNRRVAALKILVNPTLAGNYAANFSRIARRGTVPKTVSVLVVSSREEADHWIDLRHAGYDEGRGVKTWSSEQKARRRQRQNRSVDSGTARSIVIANDVQGAYADDPELLDLVKSAREERLTSIGRLFSPDVLTRLHFKVEPLHSEHGRLWVSNSNSELRDFFVWSFSYVANNGVDKYKNASIRSILLDSCPNLPQPSCAHRVLVGATSSHSIPSTSLEFSAGEGPTGYSESSTNGSPSEAAASGRAVVNGDAGKGTPKPLAASRCLYSGLTLPNSTPAIQGLLSEMQRLPVAANQHILCTLNRVVVELVVSQVKVLAWSGAQEKDPLKDKIVACLRKLDPHLERGRGYDQTLRQAFLECDQLSMMYMHSFVHNPHVIGDANLARRFANSFEEMLRRVDASI